MMKHLKSTAAEVPSVLIPFGVTQDNSIEHLLERV